jgi:phosphopantothenoylcysteine decarboxylase/phosphopantothenate--cysteine ligase
VAETASSRGAEVVLVTSARLTPDPSSAASIRVVPVETAADMEEAVRAETGTADVVVMAAAVADFRPKAPAERKLVKDDGIPEIVLEPTPDILAGVAAARRPGQVLVGFAAETDDPLERGRRKLVRKGVDLMVVNDVTAPGAGFDHDTNAVTILDAQGGAEELSLRSKHAVAAALLDRVSALLGRESPGGGAERKQTS